MIPVGDNVPTRGTPVVNWLIIILNFVAFFVELAQGPYLEEFVYRWGLIPAVLTGQIAPLADAAPAPVTLFTAMFLHGGWAHIVGNMLFLWVFGDNVEDAMGSARYIVFYLLAGIAASLAQVALMPEATLPTIGASGAVAGVLGAYIIMHPRAVVTVVLPLFLFFPVFQVPAFFMLGLWFLTQFTSGISSFATATGETGGVAWWAHIGGFIAGLALIFVFRRRRERGWMSYYR